MSLKDWPLSGSVKRNIMAGVAVMTAALGAVTLGHIHYGLAGLLRGELTRRGFAIGDLVAEAGSPLLLTGDDFALHRFLRDTVARNEDVSYAFLGDPAGRVAAHSFPVGIPRGLAEVHRDGAVRGMRLIDTPEEGRIQDVAVPLMDGRLGRVHIGMREARVRQRIVALALAWTALAVLVLAAGLAVAYWLTSAFSRRIDRLIAAADQVGRGELRIAAADGGSDEIGRLGLAFDRMAADLGRSQEDLLRAGKLAAIGELASGVAHEINNPLNTMGVCCQSLRERAKSPRLAAEPDFADFPEYLAAIQEEILRCKKITGSLLDFARAREPAWDAVQLNDVVRDALPLLELRSHGKGATIEMALADDLPAVRADPDQLRQVVLNLLLNALDHLPAGGQVRVLSARRNGSALVRVSDDGPGIPPENLPRLFEPFFTTKPAGQGTGLGLAICRRIVESHGGRIEAESAPGRGAAFTVTLPVAEGQDA